MVMGSDPVFPRELGIHALYASRRHLPPEVRQPIDFLVRSFAQRPWPE